MANAAADVALNHPVYFGVADQLKLEVLHFEHGVSVELGC